MLAGHWRKYVAIAFVLSASYISKAESTMRGSPFPEENREGPHIFAAAETRTALDAVAAAWHENSGKAVTLTYGSSSALAAEIGFGKPADIFVSTDLESMDVVEKKSLIRHGTRRHLLGDRLVLIEAADGSSLMLKIEPDFDLAGAVGDSKIAICGASCPAGARAKDALRKLDVWQQTESKLIEAESGAKAVQLVADGQAKFAIVYETEAKPEAKIKIIASFPPRTYDAVIYPIALLERSSNPDAMRFLAFFSSQAAIKIFHDRGFSILSK